MSKQTIEASSGAPDRFSVSRKVQNQEEAGEWDGGTLFKISSTPKVR